MRKKDQISTDAYGRLLDSKTNEHSFEWSKNFEPNRKRFNDYYFAGYTTYTRIGSNGKKEIVRQYDGVLYHQEITPEQVIHHRILCAVLAAISVGFFGGSLFLNISSNKCWYVMAFAWVVGAFLIRFLFSLHAYIWSKQDLKEYEYTRGAQMLTKRRWPVLLSMVVLIVVTCSMFYVEAHSYTHLEILRFVMLTISGVCIWLIGRMESNIHYSEMQPKDRQPR